MRNIVSVALLLLSFIGFSQNTINLESVNETTDYAKFVITTEGINLSQGFVIEVANNECGIDDSEYLKSPIQYSSQSSSQGTFVRISDNQYEFTTPFSASELSAKWFRWRVINSEGTSDWKCFSWSTYCDKFLTPEGNCK